MNTAGWNCAAGACTNSAGAVLNDSNERNTACKKADGTHFTPSVKRAATNLATTTTAPTKSNKKTWTGTGVTIGTATMTPSASSDYSIATDGKMTVTYTTMANLNTNWTFVESVESWWCMKDTDTAKTACHLWKFVAKDKSPAVNK
jgi:hypothetical protein